jgi:transmembrane sensor
VQASAATATLAAEVAMRASQWWAILQGPNVAPETYDAWRLWHDGDAEHRRAWQQLLHAGTSPGGGLLPVHEVEPGAVSPDRRQWLHRVAGVAAVGTGLWLARDLSLVQEWRADYRSATGEILALTLLDGSAVVLNTASACDVRFDTVQRTVALINGEAEVHGASRPLVVDTPQGRITAVGGRFSAYRRDEGVVVRVFQGRVTVQSTSPVPRVTLHAGEQLRFGEGGAGPVGRVSPNADAWVSGTLVARDLALGDFIAQLARYRTGWLSCDEAVAGLLISGVYPVSDPERVLQALPRTLPVDVRRFTRYWTTVVPAGA